MTDPDLEVQAAQVLRGRDGRRTPVDVRAVGVTIDGRFAGIQGAARDVSDQVRLERELRRQAGELAAGEERAHLARELHDSVTQALFSMTLVSRSVEMLLETDPDAARAHLVQLRELQREALAEMRALIFELRPGNLESDGLVRALKTHTAALQGRLGLPVVVESDLEDRLPLAAEEVLYRIAQEALHNVVKHAAARQVRVEVRQHDGGVRLRVEDDGKGFDPATVPDGHLGLAGMRARADRVGATFACESRPGSGHLHRGRARARRVGRAAGGRRGRRRDDARSRARRRRRRSATDDVAQDRSFRPGRARSKVAFADAVAAGTIRPCPNPRPAPIDGSVSSSSTRTTASGRASPACWPSATTCRSSAAQAWPGRPWTLACECRPDVVVVDPRLPEVDGGLDFIAGLRARCPEVRIVAMCWSDALERTALDGGAHAFLRKTFRPTELIAAIVAAGRPTDA